MAALRVNLASAAVEDVRKEGCALRVDEPQLLVCAEADGKSRSEHPVNRDENRRAAV